MFQVQAELSTVRPVFSDYVSISYDYALIESNYQLLIIAKTDPLE